MTDETPKPDRRIPDALIDQLLEGYSKPEDLVGDSGILKQLTSRLVERALQGEMTAHLGYPKHGRSAGNARNGTGSKTLKTDHGPVQIEVPRDRDGTFEPQLVKKRQRKLEGFDDKILALYARGMSTRDIQGHLQELYGIEISPSYVSSVTEAVIEDVVAWQNRPLESLYVVVFLDALVVKVRDQGSVRNKAVYIALGVTTRGTKEVLGMWIEATEGARFWLKVVTELKQRGVDDVLVVCCDGLKGFPEAIEAAFPRAIVQTCIVHMLRNSLRFVSFKDRRALARDLREVYTAVNREHAQLALQTFEERWSARYPTIGESWRTNWERVVPFLDFPPEIRRVIYTTNAIEALNAGLRKLTHYRGHFPNDESLLKLLYMALSRFERQWSHRAGTWGATLGHFATYFKGRIPAC